jgi:hypothetical protein
VTSKELSVERTLRTSPENLLAMVNHLQHAAQNLHESQPAEYRLDLQWDPSSRVVNMSYLPLQFEYWGLLCRVHSIFLYPWVNDVLERVCSGRWARDRIADAADLDRQKSWIEKLRVQCQKSSEILADASRKLILTTKAIPVEAGCSKTYV